MRTLLAGILSLSSAAAFADGCTSSAFGSNNGAMPPKSTYSGPLFSLSHAYPSTVASSSSPWRDAIGNGEINVDNAGAYVLALKKFISKDMRAMLASASWNPADHGWYHEPWLNCERESIHGMYVGTGDFDKGLFAGSGLKKDFSTYVLTMYNQVAASTLYNVWGSTGLTPSITATSGQFPENGIVIKYAFTTANGDNWDAMKGAHEWPLYITTNATS